jgi:hypothetical protein
MAAVHALSASGQAALDEHKRTIRDMVGRGVITAAHGSAIYFQRVREVIQNGAMQETSNERMVFVQCNACHRVEKIAGNVLRYSCRCSPAVEQFTFKNRTLII